VGRGKDPQRSGVTRVEINHRTIHLTQRRTAIPIAKRTPHPYWRKYCHVLTVRITGEPPVFRGKPRFCEKDTVRRRKEKNDERKQQTNGKPWRSRIALRLKPPDVLSSRFHHYNAL
jgi:hypothetical protein